MKFIPSFLPVALSLSLLSLLASEAVFADTSVVNSADPSIVNSAKNTTERASEASLDSSESSSEPINQQVDEHKIVVRSQWRSRDLQNLPTSIAVLFSDSLENRSAQHLDDVLRSVANVNFNTGASRGRFVQIRGIGERSQFQDPINPSVGFYIDGVDFSGVFGAGTLFDVAQVEVLRGPQGARFGSSSLAGAIYIETEAADSETDYIDLTLAEEGTFGAGVATGTNLDEQWSVRFSAEQFLSDGFIYNQFLNRDDTNNFDEQTARLKAKWQAADDLELNFAWHHLDIDNGYDTFSLDNDRQTRSDEPGFDRQMTDALSVQGTLLGASVNTEFSLAVSDTELDYGYDEDWTYDGFHPIGYSSFDRYLRDWQNINGDLRWLSNQSIDMLGGKTDWVMGVYFREEEEDLTRQYTYLANDFEYDYQTSTVSLYGELQTAYSARWSSVIGLRFEQRDTDYQDNDGINRTTSDNMIGGNVAINYRWSASETVYGLLSRGFKAGGINPQTELDLPLRQFDVEKTHNAELGYKRRLTNGRLQVSAFYMERDDQQVSQYTTFVRPDNTTEFIQYIGNANNGRNKGLEMEWLWYPNDTIAFDASLGYLDTEVDTIFLADGSQIKDPDAAQAPGYTYHLGLTYTPDQHWSANVSFEGADDYFFSDSHQERSLPVNLVHGRLSYQQPQWKLSLWVRNLTNETYYTRGFGGFGNDPRDGYATKPYYQLAAPQQIGIDFRYLF